MSSTAVDFSSVASSLWEGVGKYLPESSDTAHIVSQSTALLQITYTTLKNLPYINFAPKFEINDVAHALSSRISYLEASLLCLASSVHNIFCAVVYTFFFIGSFGCSANINTTCRVHWVLCMYGILGMGIGFIGMAKPKYGMYLYIWLMSNILEAFKQGYQRDNIRSEREFVEYIQDMARKYSSFFHKFFQHNEENYKNFYKDSLIHIEARIHSARRTNDFIELIKDFRNEWPFMGSSSAKKNSPQPLKKSLGSTAALHHYV